MGLIIGSAKTVLGQYDYMYFHPSAEMKNWILEALLISCQAFALVVLMAMEVDFQLVWCAYFQSTYAFILPSVSEHNQGNLIMHFQYAFRH